MPDHTSTTKGSGSLYAQERQSRILQIAATDGRVEVAGAAEHLGVTPETVRRDLKALESSGRLHRVHGGAIPVEKLDFEPTLAIRTQAQADEKARIAAAALQLLPEEGTVIVDGGSTTALLAEGFPRDRKLTVVTASLPLASALLPLSNVSLHLLGGYVRARTQTAVGDWATAALGELYADLAILGTNGLSVEHGLTTPDQREASVKRAIMTASRRRVVLVDSTKIGVDHFTRFATLEQIDTVVTDSAAAAKTCNAITAAGPEVICA
ncbi:DeoR/GlpR family DNA-binding transcription regulator [Rudaeicoccus suwonensis]|uniref:Lactose phosphotransferase system repressor n=1 Tax=Rudaeicoccus suwonensis TaxID=657409 RepID=A0A561DX33_9MICO|nr:DeoR/GlpR family DNA-binding transcription regulator [Rudaeicoccus suwonensis]TWE07938.1 DeoR family transcriptional regulator [Rudaeicoccus suwonensis]